MNRYFTLCLASAVLLCGCKTQNEFDATGTFEAESVTISAETNGRILEFDVREGESVHAGESVCVIDSAAFVLQRRTLAAQQKALLAGKPDTQKQLGSLREQITKQQREVDRLKALVNDDAATPKQLDDATAQLRVLQSQYDATLSTLRGSSASIDGNVAVITTQMDQADYNIDKCRVTAPIRGTVLTKYMQAHEFATAGKPLLKIADLIETGLRPALVIGVPVGFVNVVESKERLFAVCQEYGVPAIVAMGRKGGSTVAAAVSTIIIMLKNPDTMVCVMSRMLTLWSAM